MSGHDDLLNYDNIVEGDSLDLVDVDNLPLVPFLARQHAQVVVEMEARAAADARLSEAERTRVYAARRSYSDPVTGKAYATRFNALAARYFAEFLAHSAYPESEMVRTAALVFACERASYACPDCPDAEREPVERKGKQYAVCPVCGGTWLLDHGPITPTWFREESK